jgi:acyl dehydratase
MAPSDQERNADGAVQLGPFQVRLEPDRVAAFDAALGLSSRPPSVPLIYPIRWLVRPEVQGALEDVVGPQAIHVSQAFDYLAPVSADADYLLRVTIERHEAPLPRAIMRATVHGHDDKPVLALETVVYPAAAVSTAPSSRAPQARTGTLPEVTIAPIDTAQVERYADAADDHSRLHCDPDFARSVGLDGPIVHGMMVMGLFQRALGTWVAAARVERLFAMFVQPVLVGSGLVIAGRIAPAPKTTGRDRQVLRLFVRTDRDQLACIGEATLHIDPSTQPAPLTTL